MKTTPRFRSYDVAVVGAGPAGCMAAMGLALAGVNVALFEKANLPRHKVCGGGVVSRAMRLLENSVQTVHFQHYHGAEVNLLDIGIGFEVRREVPIVSMARRSDLDFQLALSAQIAGAHLWVGCRIEDLRVRRQRMEIESNQGRFLARFVVAADGVLGQTARKVGFVDSRRLIPALEAEVPANKKYTNGLENKPRFDFGMIPGGYSWVFPKNDHIGLGAVSKVGRFSDLREAFRQYLGSLGIPGSGQVKARGFFIPVSPMKGGFVKNRTLLVGDAAGLADPVTFEGITHAIVSGRLAARALLEGEMEPARTKEAYERHLDEGILLELKWGRRISKMIYTLAGLRNWLFQTYGDQMVEAITDVFTGDKTYRGLLSNPKTYLKRLCPPKSGREG